MEDDTTELKIQSNKPTAISSQVYGASNDAVGFNLAFIALKNPKLAVELIQLYSQAQAIKDTDPKAPDEDFELFTEALKNLTNQDN